VIRYTERVEGVAPDDLRGFFEGWPNPPSPERHLEILRRSHTVVLAVDDENGRVMGFATAISDGVLSAYIPLLEVLPEYRGRGIGRALMERMLDRLDGLYMIDLVASERAVNFYERLGFGKALGMVRRDFDAQAGKDPDAGDDRDG
jgi:ribosomal protein S18 acetylase RimI-like enzyme